MTTTENPRSYPPETLEGWYVLHQFFTVDGGANWHPSNTRGAAATPASDAPTASHSVDGGWTAWARVIGSAADLMVIHFAPTLEGIAAFQDDARRLPIMNALRLHSSFLSVTEAGLYHLTSEVAREALERGGMVGDEAYAAELARRVDKERESSYVRRRLYPPRPENMPYVSFYPMSKRRAPGQNWYTEPLAERSRLMHAHGKTGRRYSGRVVQIITGAIGFDAWEWGVTLFAKDPLDFKKIVTEMRFDEVSARYADFGSFYVGKLVPAAELESLVETLGKRGA